MGTINAMVIGLILGILASVVVGRAAHDHELAAALPSPWLTASLGLVIVVIGWVAGNAIPRFAAALALAAAPGAAYGAVMLAQDGNRQLAYGWSAVPIALACLAFGAGFHTTNSRNRHKSWSSRRRNAPRLPRVRTR